MNIKWWLRLFYPSYKLLKIYLVVSYTDIHFQQTLITCSGLTIYKKNSLLSYTLLTKNSKSVLVYIYIKRICFPILLPLLSMSHYIFHHHPNCNHYSSAPYKALMMMTWRAHKERDNSIYFHIYYHLFIINCIYTAIILQIYWIRKNCNI